MAITIPTDAYCEATDVERVTGKSYSTTSTPTTAQVEQLIKEHGDLLNAAISAGGWTVPVASGTTRSLNILQVLNAKGAAADAENAAPGAARASARTERWAKEVADARMALAKGNLDLPDATKGDDTQITEAAQEIAYQFNPDADGVEVDRVFSRATKW